MILAPTLSLSSGSGALQRPTFSRDFAGEKTLNNGTGPAITFTRASNATYFDANGVLQTAGNNVPRFDHSGGSSLGLLIEEARTNHCTNSEASGAIGVTGPTGWFINNTGANGLTRTITQGTLSGFSYIDVRFEGTTNAAVNMRIGDALPSTGATASSGQPWTASAYIALQAGSIPSGATLRLVLRARDSSNTAIQTINTDISPTSSLVRYVASGTFSGATITQACHEIRLEDLTISTAVDFTLRIAAPQLEQGAFPTSYIPTTTAEATRSADSAIVEPISSFYNGAEGTIYNEFSVPVLDGATTARGIVTFTESGGFTNRLIVGFRGTGAQFFTLVNNNVEDFNVTGTAGIILANATAKSCVAYKSTDSARALNGASAVAITSAITTPTRERLLLGQSAASVLYNGHIRKIAYFPKRLSNALLQQLTT